MDEFVSRTEDDGDIGLDDGMTLEQLKKQFFKKWKHIHCGESSEHDTANGKPVEDESDLNEPLINFKPKRSKISKSKRKHSNPSVISSSTIDITVKPEGDLVSEDSQQAVNELAPFIHVKIEVLDAEQSECQQKTEADCPSELDDSLISPVKNCHSNPQIILLKTKEKLISREDTIADEEQPSTCSFDSIYSNSLNCEGCIENELLKAEEKHNSPELHQPLERLLATRKAISPSSQERLRMAMNVVETVNAEQNIVSECKEYDKITINHRRPTLVSQQKVIRSPRRIIKWSQIPKCNIEGPHFSRTSPNLNTGGTTTQGCSEGAVAFSQRQMRDMESLSEKLMNELKSMKDIVEQKLLFEAYRNVSLKNDADEVKLAIDSATKVEEMTRKWLSLLARDCNRFCTIMKMTPNSTSASSDAVPRENRKIMFADEAGGKLSCQII